MQFKLLLIKRGAYNTVDKLLDPTNSIPVVQIGLDLMDSLLSEYEQMKVGMSALLLERAQLELATKDQMEQAV